MQFHFDSKDLFNKFKKFFTVFLSIVLLFGALFAIPNMASAAENTEDSTLTSTNLITNNSIYVALGDSVPAGYALPSKKDSYVQLFSKTMADSGYTNTVYNYAVSGATTQALLTSLEKMQSAEGEALQTVKNARVITLNIGGNNVLGPFVGAVNAKLSAQLTELGIKSIAEASPEQLWTIASTLFSMTLDPDQLTQIQQGAQSFGADFPKIIEWLKTNAPDATIIISTIYNPIPSILSFYNTSESLLKEMNTIIKKGADQYGYYVADVYTAFVNEQAKGTQILNLNLGQYSNAPISVDIHPNTAGHKLIAKVCSNLFQTIPVIVETNSNTPVKAMLSLSGKVDKKGALTATVTKGNLKQVIDKAKAEATRLGREDDGIAVVFSNQNTGVKSIKIAFEAAAIDLLKSESVKEISILTNKIRFRFDQAAINKLDEKTKGTVTVKALSPSKSLINAASKLIGNRPVYQFTITDSKGTTVSDLGTGNIAISIGYTATSKEKTSNLHAILIDSKGQTKILTDSSYSDGWVSCTSNLLSTIGVGYKK